MRFRQLAVLSIALVAACAQGTVADPGDDGTTGSDTDATLPRPDSGGSNSQVGQDTGLPNNSVCIVNDTICVDANTFGRCRPDQLGYDNMPCAEGTTCVDKTCQTPAVCMPGEVDCLDELSTLTCRQTGEGWIQMTCEPPLKCAEGNCTDKLPRGAGCATDDECATGNCRCGSGTDDNCPAALGSGICANTSCTATTCGVSGFCLAADVIPTGGADYDHCVTGCDGGGACPTGSKCVSVPVRTAAGGTEYHDGCYFSGARGFGEECAAAAECLTGACLTGYFNTGFCTRRCDMDGVCSAGSDCVELITGQFWCALLCGDGSVVGSEPCPLDVPVDRFDVTCKSLPAQGGGVTRVCAAP